MRTTDPDIEAVWPFEAVVFDMDGVLVDTSQCHRHAFEQLWETLGVAGPEYASIAGRTTREVVRSVVGASAAAEDVDRWVTFKQGRARALIRSGEVLFDDAVPVLRSVSGRSYRLALASGGSRGTVDVVLDCLARAGAPSFEQVLTAEDVERGKPSPEIFSRTCERLGLPPPRVLVVEDSESGVRAALAAGAFVVPVRGEGGVRHARCLGAAADLHEVLNRLPEPGA